jgi:dihydrolipoamide dehydrogenase
LLRGVARAGIAEEQEAHAALRLTRGESAQKENEAHGRGLAHLGPADHGVLLHVCYRARRELYMEFDAIVIGAGPGGYPCAIRLAQLGKKVAVIEEDKVGGVCLNVGCIPSKAMIQAAHRFADAQHGEKFGIKAKNVSFDMKTMQAWKNEQVVGKFVNGVRQLLKGNGVHTITGRAELKSANEIVVKNGADTLEVRAKDIVIATGSAPIDIPAFKIDGKTVMGSTEILDLDRVPEKVVVLGGGYIGLELGSALCHLGSKVTVVEMLPRLLAGFDMDLVQVVQRRMKQNGVDFRLETKAEEITETSDGRGLRVSKGGASEVIPFDVLAVTVGRRPRGKELALERFGVKVDQKGFIEVDAQLRTANPHIYAIGDVCGQPMLAHKATRDGEVAAEVIAGHTHAAVQNKTVPAVVFTDPELASAGMSEVEAVAAGRKIEVGKFPFVALGRAMAGGVSDGFGKIVFDASSRVVLGIHVVGPHATDLISEAALAIEMGATVEDLALTIHPHPTLGEVMMEASKVGLGEAVHVLPQKKAAS